MNNQANYTVERHNSNTGSYEKKESCKLDEQTADQVVRYLTDCLNVDGFYRHTIHYADGRKYVKHSSYSEVLGIIEALLSVLEFEKQNLKICSKDY